MCTYKYNWYNEWICQRENIWIILYLWQAFLAFEGNFAVPKWKLWMYYMLLWHYNPYLLDLKASKWLFLVLATLATFSRPANTCTQTRTRTIFMHNNKVDNSMYFQLQRPGRMDHPSERGQAGPCTSSPLDPPLSNSLQTKWYPGTAIIRWNCSFMYVSNGLTNSYQ